MSNEASFYALTAQRWPMGVACPKCGTADVLRGTQPGRNRQLWYCHNPECKTQFSVTSGTVMEFSKLPLRKWLLAFHLMSASKKGISSLQLSRMLDITYKTAWHLTHRIRATMTDNSQWFSGIVETDETYIGGKRKNVGRGYRKNKMAVQTIIKRGKKCTRKHPCKHGEQPVLSQAQTIALNPEGNVDGRTVGAKLRLHTDPAKTILMTDQSAIYDRVGQRFANHLTVNHAEEEYVRIEPDGTIVTTNTAEGFFANLKRQIIGTHHHTSKRHLHRYLEEHDYNYNNRGLTDTQRAEFAIASIEGISVRYYESAHGRGDHLIGHKVGEPAPVVRERDTCEVWGCPGCGRIPCIRAEGAR